MSMYRKLLPYAFFLFAACALLSPDVAWAQQPQPTPRFVFVETNPISLEAGGKPSETRLQNNTAEDLEVVVEVTDVDPKVPKDPHGVSANVNFAPQTVRLLPAGSAIIKINPPPASVTNYGPGYLVAVERGKWFARREIEGRTPAEQPPPPPPTPKIVEPAVPMVSLESIHLPGINFLPSFTSRFSPIWPLLLLLPFLWLGVRLAKSSGARSLIYKIGGAALVILPVILLGVIMGKGAWQDNATSLVVVPPVSLSSSQKLTGGLISADGSLGKLEADGFQLKATGIRRAGAYEGKLKVPQVSKPDEFKDIKVQSNVSDWWPYAFLTFTVGVLLGYYLTRYFKQQRLEEEQRVRAAQLWLRVSEDESRFLLEHGGQPYAGYSIVGAGKEWLEAVERMLATHQNSTGAKASLDRFEIYVNLFAQFRGQLLALNNLQTNVWDFIRQHEPKIAQVKTDLKVFSKTEEVLTGESLPFTTDEEQQSTKLKSYQSQVQQQTDWLKILEETLITINGYLKTAETQGWGQDALKTFKKARQAAIIAGKKDEVVAVDNEAATAYANILKPLVADAEAVGARDAARSALKEQAAVEIELSSAALVTGGKESHDPDDLFIFTANVTLPPVLGVYRLRWDFGDGTTSDIPASALSPGESVQVQVSHRYSKSGAKKVTIKNSEGDVLGELKVMVGKGPGRAERLLAAFRLTEWQMNIVTGLVAIGLGFHTFYLSKTVWGTPADYLYAILWGSIVSEGLKYAAGLVARVWAQ